ncbi:VWA domain-containing protein [Galbibacter pacificus]|uniref:VWA domain-containing protein n=1 Tax=Galbibacter pacificus TaxID=2996052 RepID=A0ABT6FVC7_9FLAO|nr:VWA domain-containing protein [Galbibacter pacificus]MDG3583880.1 VWA domain-containing protein [Galbibacter pacificus]MDG3587202.1 VWA domain-containing protein [Galbibacter pacificus]
MYKDLLPINWSDFHFLRPQFLWLMVPVIVLIIISLLSMRQELKWKKIIAPHLRAYVISKGSNAIKIWMHIVLLIAFLFGIMGLSGPTWKKIELPGQKLETPMVVLLDLSQSMMSEDIQPNRLERAKFKIKDLIKYNPRARMALIGFAGTAHTIVPLTKDYKIINSHIEGLKPSVMPYPGSDLQAALKLGDSLTQVTKAPGTIVVFSDDFGEKERAILNTFVQNSKNKVVILAMNTPSGANVKDIRGREVKNSKGEVVRSYLDNNVMASMNAIEGITVQPLTLDDSDVEVIAKTIKENLVFIEKKQEKENDWRDLGLLAVIPMAFFMLLWFRRGWVLYTLVFLFLTSCSGEGTSFKDVWFTPDYQGQRLSDKNNFEDAAKTYTDPMRKGVAYFKAGDYEKAVDEFSMDTTAMGAYNLGLAYFKNGDYEAAAFAFNQAVEKDPSLENAKENQQQLMRLLPQTDGMTPDNAQEAAPDKRAKNKQNNSMEDLSGGGQEATKKDMEKQRLEEDVASNIHKGKELNEVPDNIEASIQKQNNNLLMRKVDDDPSIFLQKKFRYQVKKYNIKPTGNETAW